MQLVESYDSVPARLKGSVVALGNFDGVHLGHKAVIGKARELARASGSPSAVLTFEPHPRIVFKPDQPPFRLTPKDQKAKFIGQEGIDCCVMQAFDIGFSRMSATEFVEKILVSGMGASHLVVGYDFKFGKGREGNCDFLQANAAEFGFSTTRVDPLNDRDGNPLSSTRVREALLAGDLAQAEAILGRQHEIAGEVMEGDKRGRTIGFPTANIGLADYQRPRFGVYSVRAEMPDGRLVDGVANIGSRPTVDGKDERLEVHLFDLDEDLYGKRLSIRLCSFIRPEMKFSSFDELKSRIAEDAQTARSVLADMK
jgi:riboflavin kinase/FMN adenylyltransferase